MLASLGETAAVEKGKQLESVIPGGGAQMTGPVVHIRFHTRAAQQ